jgi:diacylglycerol O-acyltransferase / wax synthase
VIDHDDTDASGYRDRLTAVIRARLAELPRFRHRIVVPESSWRRPSWAPVADVDWQWHIPMRDLADAAGNPGGLSALNSLVAELQSTPLPLDRPPWRFVAATEFAPGKIAAILIVHHAVADGLQILAQTAALLEPTAGVAVPVGDRPGFGRRAVGTVIGLAQLATDGRKHHLLPSGDGVRFGRLAVPLADLRDAARAHRVRVTDVLLSITAGALSRLPDPVPPSVRVEVPVTMRVPGAQADGNATGAVMIELPLDRMPESERLAEIGRRSRRLDTGTRALGSRFVIGVVCEMMPAPLLSKFARTVYGHRFFQAIMSNMPGPVGTYRLAGAPITEVYPIVPLAPRVPLAVGSLSWGAPRRERRPHTGRRRRVHGGVSGHPGRPAGFWCPAAPQRGRMTPGDGTSVPTANRCGVVGSTG